MLYKIFLIDVMINETISKLIETSVWRREFGLTHDPLALMTPTLPDLLESETKTGTSNFRLRQERFCFCCT